MATQTKIKTADGREGVGYIINGETFKDAAGTQRIDKGTTVYTNGGEFTYQGNGVSTPYYKGSYHDSNGNVNPAYIRNGTAYTDPGLTNKVDYGSVVTTQNGDYYKSAQTGNGVQVYKTGGAQNSFNYGDRHYKIFKDDKGTLFLDEARTTRVPDGASVTINGRAYINSYKDGLVPAATTAAANYGDRVKGAEVKFTNAAQEQVRATKARTNQRVEELNKRRAAIEAEYERNNKASYNAYLNSVSPYGVNAEKLASLGLSDSGYAESTMVKLAGIYQNALSGNGADRANALLEIELAIDDAIADGNEAEANIYSQMHTTLAEMQMQSAKQETDYEMAAADAYNADYWAERELNESARQADEKNDLERELLETKNAHDTAETVIGWLAKGLSYDYISRLLGIPVNTLKTVVSQYYQ